MKIIILTMVGVLFVLFLPLFAETELLWFDDFEKVAIGGPAQRWGYPGTLYSDTTWKEEANTILEIIKDDFLVNDDTTAEYLQEFPAIGMGTSGNFVICWGDRRNGLYGPDIYAQRYSSSGDALGENFRVDDVAGLGYQHRPSIAMDGDSGFVICWDDRRNDWDPDIYAQRYGSSGDPLGANFRVNDDAGSSYQSFPSIAADADSVFVICWRDCRNGPGDSDIYAQRYGSSGEPLGANFRVNDDAGSSGQLHPSVAMNWGGDFVICWHDNRSGDSDIYAQRYGSSGEPLGANFRVNDDVGSSDQWTPSMSMSADRGFVICWRDCRNGPGDSDIYAQRYGSSGDPLGANFRVNDDVGSSDPWCPSISMGTDGEFVICWQDHRNGDLDIFAQRYHSDGTPLGENYIVNQRPNACYPDQIEPSVALSDNWIAFAWMDARRSEALYISWDIYAKVVPWDWVKVDEPGDNDFDLPKDYALLQNYPNPFNAQTRIQYDLPKDSRVSLQIYNILGQRVKTLANEHQCAGHYQVIWDGRDQKGIEVASGIYFIGFKAGTYETTRKMLMLR